MQEAAVKAISTLRYRQTAVLLAMFLFAGSTSHALLPTSPRVQRLVEAGLRTLETRAPSNHNEKKLGAKCVVGLAMYKAGRKNHARVQEAIAACKAEAGAMAKLDNYSHGLAIVFLAEVAAKSNEPLLRSYLDGLRRKQKSNGGWGYSTTSKGDTSQTQYAALALWQVYQAGYKPESNATRSLLNWLLNTQDPSGAWGYQGKISPEGGQTNQTEISQTMVAAAGASLMITADLHGLLFEGALEQEAGNFDLDLPPAVKQFGERKTLGKAKPLPTKGVDWQRVSKSLRAAEAWMDSNLNLTPEEWACYYLYSVERYQSFREARAGQFELEPAWYEKGVAWLESNQKEPGVWNEQSGATIDTAFAILFLVRSTQKSLNAGLGEGAMVSGRGLPKDLASAQLRRGQVITEIDPVGVDDFLALIDQGESDQLDALAADPSSLIVGDLASADADRLEQMLRTGEPTQRLIAATALGRAGRLDHVPALLYGLTDPDTPVALAARDGLRFISRRPRGFGMPDNYNDDQRYLALEKWRVWYLGLRPEATIDLGR